MRAPGRWSAAALVLLAAAGARPARGAEPSTLAERLVQARERLAADLVAVAQFTVGEGLEGRRDHTLRFVLSLEPENPEARRALGWTRKKGAWVAPPAKPAPADERPARLPQWRARWDAAFARARDALLPAIGPADPVADRVAAVALLRRGLPEDAAVRGALDPLLAGLRDRAASPSSLERLEDALERHAPDDPAVREARGHVRRGERWILAETSRASARRAALRAAVREVLAAEPRPARVEPFEEEAGVGLPKVRAWEAPNARVVGTVADAALSQVAFHLDRSGRVFDALFGRPRDWDPPLLAWEVADLAQARVVARHLGARDRTLEEMRLYASTWMGPAILTWETGPRDETPWRVDAGLKAAQTRRLRLVYDLGASGHEALGDALARYLVWRQAGTRLTWPIDRSYVDPLKGASLGRLHDARFDWAKAAAELLAPASARGALRLALGKSIEAQTPEDALVAYAFAAYVFEGHADAAHPFALRMGGGQGLAAGVPALGDEDEGDEPPAEARPDLDGAFLATLGWRVEQVERRLERWCREAGP